MTFEEYLADEANLEAVGDVVYMAEMIEAAYYNNEWADLAHFLGQFEYRLNLLRVRAGLVSQPPFTEPLDD